MTAGSPAPESVAFVLCVERGILEGQAVLLCESIRAFAGRHRRAPILAVAPRPGREPSPGTRKRLADLDVDYVAADLNRDCPEYGSANRVYAASHAESRLPADVIVVLDSDTLFLREPDLALGPAAVGLRPVDQKGISTAGPSDPFEPYWEAIGRACGVDHRAIPYVETTVDRVTVRANYNAGLVVARRRAGLLARWADCFSRIVRDGLKPRPGQGYDTYSSIGYIGLAAGEWWGSNQAALSLAVHGAGARVRMFEPTYNLPLHSWEEWEHASGRLDFQQVVHVHYHYMFEAGRLPDNPLLNATRGLDADRQAWIRSRTPLVGPD